MNKNYSRWGRFMLTLSFLLTLTAGFSQVQLTVVPAGGTLGNTDGTGADPISDYYNSIRYQVVYTAAELSAAGIVANDVIIGLAWDVTQVSGNLNDYTIKMGHTTAANSAVHDASPTTVVKNPFVYTPTVGLTDINFDAGFVWNGTDNILVEICTGPSNPYGAPHGGVTAQTGITDGSRYIQADGVGSQCSVTTNNTSTDKPHVRLIIEIPVPPTPIQAAGTPTCASGSTIDLTGTPATGTTWYWQTSATGTSTANAYAGPLAITANGTYYARALNTAHNAWSAASSITVTNFPVATTPPAPTAAANPACTPGTTISMPAAPAGTEYYWQGTTVNGSSNANPATAPYNVTATGTYTVAAYETATQCWSTTSSVSITVDNVIPPVAIVNPTYFNYCTSAAAMPVTATAPAPSTNLLTCSVSATASGEDGASTTATVNNFSCSSGGTIVSATLDASIGVWCSDWYAFNIIVNGNPVATNQCDLTGFDLTPYLPLTSVSIVSVNTDSWDDDWVDMSLTVDISYVTQPYSLSWFTASTGGTPFTTGSPVEAIGTPVMPTVAVGSYDFYVANNQGGCQSARTLVTVNVTDVLADLTPVNVSCNGMNDGSFTLGTVTCGLAPFTYSVDGGAFGPIPTNLTPGTHSIVMKDANNLNSAPISITITQPTAPTALTAYNVTFYNGMLTWTPQGNETTWNVEYGPTGFTPGSGTMLSNVTNDTIPVNGLDEDTDYQFYVQAGCIATSAWGGPVAFSTDAEYFTWDASCTDFIDISTTGTNTGLTDDGEVGVTLPWAWTVNGTAVNTITIGNNGGVLFNTLTGNVGYTASANGFFPYSQDLNTPNADGGVFYESVGTAPNRKFVILWKNITHYNFPAVTDGATFELIYEEATGETYFLYQDVMMGNGSWNNGSDAEIAAITPNGNAIVSTNSPTYLTNNSCVRFYKAHCPNVQNMMTITYYNDAQLNWDASLYGETAWTLVYGEEGFDPSVPGEAIDTLQLTSSDTDFGGTLDQLTTYDVYIYSECQADTLTSDGYFLQFTTKPACADITALAGTTDADSLELTWNWTAADAILFPVTGFNIQYGMTGFTLGTGEIVPAAGINFSDTIHDTDLMASGVYQVYVQAECNGTNDSSNWVGPITVIMPVTNDVVCSQEALLLGQTYTLNNTGATVSLNETNIAPPATGAQTTDGWVNTTLNGTLWYTFVAPASGSVRINSTAINYNGQAAVYSATNCADFNTFTLLAANDDAIGGTSVAPNFTVCGLTPGTTYYLMYDKFDGTSGTFSLALSEIVLEGGNALPLTEICTGATVDLFTTISGNDAGGMWTSDIAAVNASIAGSTLTSTGLAYTTLDFEYRVVDGCAYDSIISQVKIYAPSNAGEDGNITACKNEPIDLLSGLNGNADLNGDWYDPSQNPMSSSQATTPNFPGQYNYDYISGNGVCPDDTAMVVVTVTNCNWLSVDENALEEMTIYPNPSTGVVFIESTFATGNFNLVVTDINGRTIQTGTNSVSAGTNTVDLKDVERGTYFFKLSNENAEKVFKVVIQ